MREQLIQLIRQEGYDLISAAEIAADCIQRFRESGQAKATYHIGGTSFTISKPSAR